MTFTGAVLYKRNQVFVTATLALDAQKAMFQQSTRSLSPT
jgi:hypothetical protein